MSAQLRWSLLLTPVLMVAAAGCPLPSVTWSTFEPASGASASAPLCSFEGEVPIWMLRAPRGGYEALQLHRGRATAGLVRRSEGLRLEALVAVGGWRLAGWADPTEDDALATGSLQWLHPGVALSAGTRVSVGDARPGSVLVGPPRMGILTRESFELLEPVERWLPCEALSVTVPLRSDATAARERAALGLREDQPLRGLRTREGALGVSVEPGAPPFLRVEPLEYQQEARVLEVRGEHSRVLIQDWTGVAVVGWVETSHLEELDDSGGGLGLLGSLAGARTRTVCTSAEELALSVARGDSAPEPIGTLAPETAFVREEALADGVLEIRPHHSAGLSLADQEVQMLLRPSQPLSCREETFDPLAGLLAARGTPEVVLAIEARVTAAEGLEGLAPGASCEVRVEAWPLNQGESCRVEARCGELLLYGHRPTNGYLVDCDLDAAAEPPRLSGGDDNPSSDGGDGAIRLDTAAGTLRISDDEAGHLGAFTVEAQILSTRREDAP